MYVPKEEEVRELGQAIYTETARLNAQPEIKVPGSPPSKRELRLEQLALAAKFNAVSLMGFAR